ncbi:hypothetical protein [Hamadaea tsunoensis]|uniref:hypothetical protein n=1 Tax=Hamadaea tsunoensis TaxID=53368 RepID=UPI0003FBBF3D|nr:hypothetical protein [Hamadaea tsunoensis]
MRRAALLALLLAAWMAPAACGPAAPNASPLASPSPPAPSRVALPAPDDDPTTGPGPLAEANVVVPSWGRQAGSRCWTGRVRLKHGQYFVEHSGKTAVTVMAYAATDLDGDGVQDYVVYLLCGEGPESPGRQVVAYRRDGDVFRPMGRLIGTQDGAAMTDFLRTDGPGRVSVLVSHVYTDGPMSGVPTQRRAYAWRDGGIEQVGGPTRWADPDEAPAAKLAVSAVKNGFDLTVVVRDTGTAAMPSARILLTVPETLHPGGLGWDGCTDVHGTGPVRYLRCTVGPIPAGGQVTAHYQLAGRSVGPAGTVSIDWTPPDVYLAGDSGEKPIG